MSPPIDLMFHVTNPKCADTLRELCNAAGRRGCKWTMFLTNDAVKLVKESWFAEATTSCDSVVVCEASWVQYAVTDSGHDSTQDTAQDSAGHCPVETGSQTSNSEMTGRARRVVSL